MNKLDLLNEIYNQETHNLMSYSTSYLMSEPKDEYKKEWELSKEKIKLIEELMDDVRSSQKDIEQKINKIDVINKEQLDELYNCSALTFEGVIKQDEEIMNYINWIKDRSEVSNPLNIYFISGKTMNEQYNLTGNNKYKDDLTIMSIKSDDIKQLTRIIVPRFEIGGRWFDDVVDNNLRREKEKEEEEEFEG